MKKYRNAGLIAALMLTVFLLAGCSLSDSFEPSQDSLYVRADGTLEEALFVTLDKSYYSEDGLRSFVEEAVCQYNADAAGIAKAYAEDDIDLPVYISQLTVESDGHTSLFLDYSSTKHYIDFNGEDGLAKQLSTGSVGSAISSGVDFSSGLRDTDGNRVSAETIEKHENYRVLLMEGAARVQVQGKVMYLTDNVTCLDSNIVYIDAEGGIACIIFK